MPVEVYGEYVDVKDLFVALVISAVLAFIAYYAVPSFVSADPKILRALSVTAGVLGALLGGIIASFFVEVKREVVEE